MPEGSQQGTFGAMHPGIFKQDNPGKQQGRNVQADEKGGTHPCKRSIAVAGGRHDCTMNNIFYNKLMREGRPHVTDEWSPLRTAVLYRRAGQELYCRRGQDSIKLAELLKEEGVEIIEPPDYQDAKQRQPLYARDPVIAIDHSLFVSPIHSPGRREEHHLVSAALQERGLAYEKSDMHGGNVLLLPDGRAIVGYKPWKEDPSETSFCEDPDEQDARILDQVRTVRHRTLHVCHYDVHVDCALAPLPDKSFLWHAGKFAQRSVLELEREFGADAFIDFPKHHHRPILNLFWVNPELVLAPDSEVCRLLEDRRYEVWKIWGDWKMQGSVRCCIAPLLRKN